MLVNERKFPKKKQILQLQPEFKHKCPEPIKAYLRNTLVPLNKKIAIIGVILVVIGTIILKENWITSLTITSIERHDEQCYGK